MFRFILLGEREYKAPATSTVLVTRALKAPLLGFVVAVYYRIENPSMACHSTCS